MILARVTRAHPQHARRRDADHLALRFQHAMPTGQTPKPALATLALLTGLQGLLGKVLDLTLLPFPHADASARPCVCQETLDLAGVQQLPAPAPQAGAGFR